MLQVVLHSNVGELCVVVSRWFGGVKLGTGGLVRAYQDSVRENLASLPLVERVPQIRLALTVEYAHVDALRRLLPAFEARPVAEEYEAQAHLTLLLPEEHLPQFTLALAGLSNGSALCRRIEDEEA